MIQINNLVDLMCMPDFSSGICEFLYPIEIVNTFKVSKYLLNFLDKDVLIKQLCLIVDMKITDYFNIDPNQKVDISRAQYPHGGRLLKKLTPFNKKEFKK